METKSRRLKRVIVAPECLALVVSGDLCVGTDIPSDAAFRGTTFDSDRGHFVIIVEHPDFDEVPENSVIPLISGPAFKRLRAMRSPRDDALLADLGIELKR